MKLRNKKILIVGAGLMAQEYLKVLLAMKFDVQVICRSNQSAEKFYKNTGHIAFAGGLGEFLNNGNIDFSIAIVAVSIEHLSTITLQLIQNGFKHILVEKPASLTTKAIQEIDNHANEKKVKVFVAYNRRFYASSQKAKEIIKSDGGVRSFSFQFTEWSHTINDLKKGPQVKEKWFLSNSTHVVDLAFFLCGEPREINCYIEGEDDISWHPIGSIFTGSGKTFDNVLFSYHADWKGPGSWGLDIITENHRLILKPMEKLQIQEIGSIQPVDYQMSYDLDERFKPGLYAQVEAFIDHNEEDLCTITHQKKSMIVFNKISNYNT